MVTFLLLLSFIAINITSLNAQSAVSEVQVARIKYRGGGDWYNDPSALLNLLDYASTNFQTSIALRYRDVELGDPSIYEYPFAFMTGHGGFIFNEQEIENLRDYLKYGGFLYIDDDYGFDESVKKLVQALFDEEKLLELPFDHAIYTTPYAFPNGLPKIHEHDGKAPKGYGVFYQGRLVLFYSYESNLADGWTDPEIHKNPAALRELSLKMGTNILYYAIIGG